MYAPPAHGRTFTPFLLHKLDLSRIAAKAQAHSTKTPFLDRAVELGLAPGAFFDRDVVPAEFIGGEHHREVLEAINWTDGLQFVLRLPSASDGGLVVKFWRFSPSPSFDEEDRCLALQLLPHLAAATEGKFLSPPARAEADAPLALDELSTPIIVTCAAAKPLYLNAAAKRLLSHGDAVVVRAGKVQPVDTKTSRLFHQAIESAAGEQKQGIEVALPRSEDRSPVLGIINGVPKEKRAGLPADAAAIIYLIDVDGCEGHAVQARRAQALFGLTDAECEVLRLFLDDLAIEEIATKRASAVATVRTQMKSILQKTRSHRQRDLLKFRRLAV